VHLLEHEGFFFLGGEHFAGVAFPEHDAGIVIFDQGVVNAFEDAGPVFIVGGNHNADIAGASGLNALNEQIGAVVEFFGAFEDLFPRFLGDFSFVAQNAGDS